MHAIRPLLTRKSWRFFNAVSRHDYLRYIHINGHRHEVGHLITLYDAAQRSTEEILRRGTSEHLRLTEMAHSVYQCRFQVHSLSSGRSAALVHCVDLDDWTRFTFSGNSFHQFWRSPQFDGNVRDIEAEIFFEKRGSSLLAAFVPVESLL